MVSICIPPGQTVFRIRRTTIGGGANWAPNCRGAPRSRSDYDVAARWDYAGSHPARADSVKRELVPVLEKRFAVERSRPVAERWPAAVVAELVRWGQVARARP